MTTIQPCPHCVNSSGIAKDAIGFNMIKCPHCNNGILIPEGQETSKSQTTGNDSQQTIDNDSQEAT